MTSDANRPNIIAIPSEETLRLKALYDYHILETLPDNRYDEIADLAASILNARSAMINLIYEDIQWAKSLHVLTDELRTLPRKESVCQHTIKTNHVLEIPDLTKDSRTKDLPFVKGKPYLKYYLGAPLITPEGYTIGALCVLDDKPRYTSQSKKNQLSVLANQVISLMELRKQNIELQKHNEFQNKLMKILSHDLRSPLNGIIGLTELLLATSVTKNNEEHSMLNNILLSSKKLNQMINDILSYTHLGDQEFTLHKEKANIEEIAEDIIELYKPSALLKQIDLRFFVDNFSENVFIDIEKFEQIIGNLVSNAIKFTPQKGTVRCSISVENKNHIDYLKVTVKDTGIGMGKTFVEGLIAGKKVQHMEGTEGEKSSGVGMSIIQSFTKLHGGHFDIESTPNKGTSFHVFIPLNV